MKKELPDI